MARFECSSCSYQSRYNSSNQTISCPKCSGTMWGPPKQERLWIFVAGEWAEIKGHDLLDIEAELSRSHNVQFAYKKPLTDVEEVQKKVFDEFMKWEKDEQA